MHEIGAVLVDDESCIQPIGAFDAGLQKSLDGTGTPTFIERRHAGSQRHSLLLMVPDLQLLESIPHIPAHEDGHHA